MTISRKKSYLIFIWRIMNRWISNSIQYLLSNNLRGFFKFYTGWEELIMPLVEGVRME